ncbi:MAG: acyloxyacyl hydrolase [Cytophagales bacterium]|nr:MAG: acyloxyacyl hydrolase [Cytophagales bacterium]
MELPNREKMVWRQVTKVFSLKKIFTFGLSSTEVYNFMIQQYIKKAALLLVLLGFLGTTKAQNSAKPILEFDASWQYGYILKHQQNVRHLAQSHPAGIQVGVFKRTTGEKGWESAYRYPKYGVVFQYLDYKNSILGESFAIVPMMKFNWMGKQKHQMEFKVGTGLVYFTNHWDLDNNPRNTMISYPLNFSMHFAWSYTYQFKPQWAVRLGTEFIHYSNAAFTLPNAGINVHTFAFGLQYTPQAQRETRKDSLAPFQRRWGMQTVLIGSAIERVPEQGYKNPIFDLSAYLVRQASRKSIWMAGFEFSHNDMVREQMEIDYQNGVIPNKQDFRRLALVVGHDWVAGRISLLLQVGVYIYRPYTLLDEPLYQRVALRYRVTNRWFGQFGVKVHYGAAERTDIGIGYQLWK